eukprot:UN26764
MFLGFLKMGSPRIQRISLLMLGDFCPDLNLLSREETISKADFLGTGMPKAKSQKKEKPTQPKGGLLGMLDDMDVVPSDTILTSNPSGFMDQICKIIGDLLTAPSGMENVQLHSHFSYVWSAECRRNLAMEYISFLRRLYSEESNTDIMSQYFCDD